MQLSDVKQVSQVVGTSNANEKLKEGWVLLAVVPATLNNGNSSAMYVLGKTEPAPDKKDPLAGLTAESLARGNQGL